MGTMDKIICVGKNYLKHARELGDAVPEEPVYFIKPPSSLCEATDGGVVAFPARGEVHHELELVFRFREVGSGFEFSEVTLGLDLTARDMQAHLKKAGLPWEKAKVFKNSAIIGPWIPVRQMDGVLSETFSLFVNGELRQRGMGRDMRFGPEFLLADLPKWFPVKTGDLLFTGTPEGVGPLKDGDQVRITGLGLDLSFACEVQ